MKKDVKNILTTIITSIIADKKLYNFYPKTTISENKFIPSGLCDLACNHLFDDRPELFGITKIQGHKVREYFQENTNSYNLELYKEFSDYFEK